MNLAALGPTAVSLSSLLPASMASPSPLPSNGLTPVERVAFPAAGSAFRSRPARAVQSKTPVESSDAIQLSRFSGLENLNADRAALLATQPTLKTVVLAELKKTIPHLPVSFDLESIHIEVFSAAFDSRGDHRKLEATETLPRLLEKCLSGGKLPSFDASLGRAYLNVGVDGAGSPVRMPIDLIRLERFVEALCHDLPGLYRSQLRGFWASPRQNAVTSNQVWLATSFGAQWLAESELCIADQTLPAASKVLLQQALKQVESAGVAVAALGPAIRIESLVVAGAPLVGAFVVDDGTAETASVLLYIPQKGLESFDSAEALHAALVQRLLEPEQRARLLELMSQADRKRSAAIPNPAVCLAPITGNWLMQLAGSHLKKQHDDLLFASDEALALGVGKDWKEFAGNLDQVADLATRLDITNELRNRNDLLVASNEPGWLKNASQAARANLRSLIVQANGTQATLPPALGNLPSLNAFAQSELNRRLAKDFPGENLNAHAISVQLASTLDVPFFNDVGDGSLPVYAGTHSWQQHRDTRTVSLMELALENIRTDSDETLQASFVDTADKRRPMSASYLKKMIRSLDVAEGYRQLIAKALVADDAQALRQTWKDALGAQMALHACVAQMGGNETQPLSVTGLGWVKKLLAKTDVSSSLGVFTRHLMLGGSVGARTGASVGDGVMVIGAPDSNRVVLYTPQAPDGQAFREFTDTRQIDGLLKLPAWQQYFLQRVSDNGKPALGKAFTSQQLPTLQTFPLPANFQNALYAASIGDHIANADFHSNSTAQANRETAIAWVRQGAELTLDVLADVLPGKLAVPLSLLRGFMATGDATAALAEGDQELAQSCFLDAFLHSVDGGFGTLGVTMGRRRPLLLTTRKNSLGAGHLSIGHAPLAPATKSSTLGRADLTGYAVSEPAGLVYRDRGIYQAANGHEYLHLDQHFYRTDLKRGQRHILRPGNWSQSFPVERVAQRWVPQSRSEGLGGGGKPGKIRAAQNAPSPQQGIAAVFADIKPLMGDISITDRPSSNANGLDQYTYDGNRNRVRQRRLEIARSLGLSLSDAPADRRFLIRLGEAVGSERGVDGKLFGQCGEMAALAALRLKEVAARQNDFVYTVQLPDSNHTVALLSKTNYPAGAKVGWATEHQAGSVIVDLWGGVLNPTQPNALVSPASTNTYTYRGTTRGWVQARVWPE